MMVNASNCSTDASHWLTASLKRSRGGCFSLARWIELFSRLVGVSLGAQRKQRTPHRTKNNKHTQKADKKKKQHKQKAQRQQQQRPRLIAGRKWHKCLSPVHCGLNGCSSHFGYLVNSLLRVVNRELLQRPNPLNIPAFQVQSVVGK